MKFFDSDNISAITASIVSHGHGDMVAQLCSNLLRHAYITKVIVTVNISESLELPEDPRVIRIDNIRPKGFGANHNAAFERCDTTYFAVINPDIGFFAGMHNLFPVLVKALQYDQFALAAPLVMHPEGYLEDSFRKFPTLLRLARKWLWGETSSYNLLQGSPLFSPDWVAGMFLLFPANNYKTIGGFDERFFLYYEDVDICARFRRLGLAPVVCPSVSVVHHAQRDSWHSWRYRRLHAASLIRYFFYHPGYLFKG